MQVGRDELLRRQARRSERHAGVRRRSCLARPRYRRESRVRVDVERLRFHLDNGTVAPSEAHLWHEGHYAVPDRTRHAGLPGRRTSDCLVTSQNVEPWLDAAPERVGVVQPHAELLERMTLVATHLESTDDARDRHLCPHFVAAWLPL